MSPASLGVVHLGSTSVRPPCSSPQEKDQYRHQRRHRSSVRFGSFSAPQRVRAAATDRRPGNAEPKTMTAAEYTRRPRKRTEAGVVRRRQLSQQ